MRNIKLVTNCERPPNYLMDIAVKHWFKNGFEPKDLIFLVNNISHFDMVKSLKESYNIEAKRANNIDEIYDPNQCVVWDDLRNILNTFKELIIRPRGIEVIQAGDEKPLNLNKTIAEQREHLRWFPSKSKACITRTPVSWMIGRHGTTCGRWPHADTSSHPELQIHAKSDISEYPGLYLVHFDKVDINLVYQLRLESQEIFKSNNRHTGVIDEKEFEDWFWEAHKDIRPGRELYKDKTFLTKVGV